ncbi:hypothetical protein [Paracidovorax sp. MALMAid1276]|uniref:hypothetical protein n=1 Tax=Paracidovorax sp. MALMAid1276 TaxID=3411631 RepID=UPI003B9D3E73
MTTRFNCPSSCGVWPRMAAWCAAWLLCGSAAWASPGAHGPNGEHLDAPGQAAASTGAAPRFEAQSDTFELVGRLQGGELSILINRFATNEPVLHAQVEVESGALKAAATFHADMGDYAVDDEAMLKQLATAGEHSLIVTVLAGPDSDLLDATLQVASPAPQAGDHGHGHELPRAAWALGVLAVLALLALLAAAAWRLGRSRTASTST